MARVSASTSARWAPSSPAVAEKRATSAADLLAAILQRGYERRSRRAADSNAPLQLVVDDARTIRRAGLLAPAGMR
jgi:hypothetical protein